MRSWLAISVRRCTEKFGSKTCFIRSASALFGVNTRDSTGPITSMRMSPKFRVIGSSICVRKSSARLSL